MESEHSQNRPRDIACGQAGALPALDDETREREWIELEAHWADVRRRGLGSPEVYEAARQALEAIAGQLRPETGAHLRRALAACCAAEAGDVPANTDPSYRANLLVWLAIATKGLCGDARHRIRQEIEAHYEQAFQSELDAGRGEIEAHVAAIAGLGNPKAARKAFHRAYLTEHESRFLSSLAKPSWWGEAGPGTMLLAPAFLFVMWGWIFLGLKDGLLMLSACAVLGFVELWLVPRLFRSGNPRRAMLWDLSAILFVAAVMLVQFAMILDRRGHPADLILCMVVCGLMALTTLLRLLRFDVPLCRKLRTPTKGTESVLRRNSTRGAKSDP